MTNQPPQANSPEQFKVCIGWLLFVAQALAVSVEVFLHKRFGERFLGLQAAAACAVIFFFPIFWEGHDVTPLIAFLVAYLCMCAFARAHMAVGARRQGQREHSYYTGWPHCMRFAGRMGEETVKCIIEPMLVFLTGVFVMPWSEPLGGYLMLASLGLFISTNVTRGQDRTRLLDMNDALIEQRKVAERFREMQRR